MTSSTTDLIRMNAADLAAAIRAGETSAVEVTRAHLDRIAAVDGAVHAFLHVDAEGALAQAEAVDAARTAGQTPASPLAGVPLALKDIAVQRGVPTTVGSKILQGWIPQYDATVVRKMRSAGIVILGKTNLDEFAMGSSTENSAYGPTRNPWDLTRIPGGSGGGSAAALAAFEAPLAFGTDTGGSIRQPASVTGTVGTKPTYGGVSRHGLVGLASSLDQGGPCARTVLDTALLHEVLAGHDPHDATSLDVPVPAAAGSARRGAAAGIAGLRIGVVAQLGGDGYQPGVLASFEEALGILRAAGAEIVEVSCPSFEHAMATYYVIMAAEVSSNLARFDAMRYGLRVGDDGSRSAEEVMAATRAAGFGTEVKRRIMLGMYALSVQHRSAFYDSALKARTVLRRDMEAAFGQVDALVSPTSPVTAFGLGEKVHDAVAMYASDMATNPASLAGIPAMSLPSGLAPDTNLPVGLQIMAPMQGETTMYRIAGAFERGWSDAHGGALLDRIGDLSTGVAAGE